MGLFMAFSASNAGNISLKTDYKSTIPLDTLLKLFDTVLQSKKMVRKIFLGWRAQYQTTESVSIVMVDL